MKVVFWLEATLIVLDALGFDIPHETRLQIQFALLILREEWTK